MNWAEILIRVVIYIICAIIGGFIVWIFGKSGLIDKIFKKHKAKKDAIKKQAQEEAEAKAKRIEKEKEDAILKKFGDIVENKIKPIRTDIEELKEKQDASTKSLVVMNRCHLKDDMEEYKTKGFATTSEKASWNEMLKVYRDNGGNHFKEYVNQWAKIVNALPTDEPKKKSRKKKVK